MTGYAPRYDQGVMGRVSRNRDMPLVSCMVSSPYYAIGTTLWVRGSVTGTLLQCRVTDVSHPRDRARHIITRRIVELDYYSALKICGSDHINHSPLECPVTVVKL